jgi:tetratricopeptide (TPR) repeat protein
MHSTGSVLVAIVLASIPAWGQDTAAKTNVALGDSLYAARNAQAALADYEAAISADSMNYEALWKAARSAVDLAEFDKDEAHRVGLYKQASAYARRAVAIHPDSATPHFHLARALGREALTYGPGTRVKYAKEVRSEALAALAIDSTNPGALHVMGAWNAEICRLSGFSRFMAKNFLGGGIFSQASWKNATDYMEKSVKYDPIRIVHHLDLGKIYQDTGDKGKARTEYEFVINAPVADFNDPHYQDDARLRLSKL